MGGRSITSKSTNYASGVLIGNYYVLDTLRLKRLNAN